jgi:hypothetical protein
MSTKVRLSNVDKGISIFTAANTYKSRKINEQVLAQQMEGNQELAKMRKQLAEANEVNRQILENQIREIEHKQEQKYYKALSFYTGEIIGQFEKVEDPMVLNYLVTSYSDKVKNNLFDANDKLDEINDKLFNKQLADRFKTLKTTIDIKAINYADNVLSKLGNLLGDFKEQQTKLSESTNSKTVYKETEIIDLPKSKHGEMIVVFAAGIVLCSTNFGININDPNYFVLSAALLLIIPFVIYVMLDMKWKKGYGLYKEQQDKKRTDELERKTQFLKEQEDSLQLMKDYLLTHPVYTAMEEITKNHPSFNVVTQEVVETEKIFFEKWA